MSAARTTVAVAQLSVPLELLYPAQAVSTTDSLDLAQDSNRSAPTTSPALSATLASMAVPATIGPLLMLIQVALAHPSLAARALLDTVAPSARPAVKH